MTETAEPLAPAAAEETGFATFDDLLNKPRRERTVDLSVNGKTLRVHLRAVSSKTYDELVASCPPTDKDKREGAIYDLATFGPKLIAACTDEPPLSQEQVQKLWNHPSWAGGEIGGLFRACVQLCQAGLDVPFNALG